MPNLSHVRDKICPTESSTSQLTALSNLAKRLDLVESPPREMALSIDRYLGNNPTAASIARIEGTMTADWAEAVFEKMLGVKRRREDAPRDGRAAAVAKGPAAAATAE